MEFVITFLEGFVSFISPCMLPLLPLYISNLAGGADKKHKVFLRALILCWALPSYSARSDCLPAQSELFEGI